MAHMIALTYSRRKRAFRVRGTDLFFGPAKATEFEAVAEWLGRKLCDNPDVQAILGVLGADSVEFERA